MPLDRDFQRREILRLATLYRKARRDIVGRLRRTNATAFQKVRGAELLREIDVTLADLKEAQRQWLDQTLPGSYRAGMRLSARAQGVDLPTMSSPHRAALGAIAGEIAQKGEEALGSVAPFVGSVFRRAQQQVLDNRQLMDILGVSTVQGLTIRELTNRFAGALRTGAASRLADAVDPGLRKDLEDLAAGRVIHITGKDGKSRAYDLEWYGETVARSASRMASSEGVVQTQQEFGEELVQMSVHSGACPLCIPWQGKIFSIHGNGSGYPPLSGENRPPLHPRCEHVLLPVVKAFLESRGLAAHMQAFSNAPDQHVRSIPEYTDLLSKKPLPVRPPPPPPPAARVRKPKPVPVPAPPPPTAPLSPDAYLVEDTIAAAEGAIFNLQNEVTSLWKEKITGRPASGITPREVVESRATRVWLAPEIDDFESGFRGLYHWSEEDGFEYKGAGKKQTFHTNGAVGMVYPREVVDVLRALTNEGRLRDAVRRDEGAKAYLKQRFGVDFKYAEGTVSQLREAYVNASHVDERHKAGPGQGVPTILKIVAHETAHSVFAAGNKWADYRWGGHAAAWQEAATELWAERHWHDVLEQLGVAPKRALSVPVGSYSALVKALHGVFTFLLGYPSNSAEYEATLLEFKFGVPLQDRAHWLATKVAASYAIPEGAGKQGLAENLSRLFRDLELGMKGAPGEAAVDILLRKARGIVAKALTEAGLDPVKALPTGPKPLSPGEAALQQYLGGRTRRAPRRRGTWAVGEAIPEATRRADKDFRDNVRSVRGRHYSKHKDTVYFDFVRPEIEALPNGKALLESLDYYAIMYSSLSQDIGLEKWLASADGRVYQEALRRVLKEKIGSDTITLYRGHYGPEWEAEVKAARAAGKKTVEVDFGGLSSWTTDPKVAAAFAAEDLRPGAKGRPDLIFSTKISIDDIVMSPMWVGAWSDEWLWENEFVVRPMGKVKVKLP